MKVIINNLEDAIITLNEYAKYGYSYSYENISPDKRESNFKVVERKKNQDDRILDDEECINLAQEVYNKHNPDYDNIVSNKLDTVIQLLKEILQELLDK